MAPLQPNQNNGYSPDGWMKLITLFASLGIAFGYGFLNAVAQRSTPFTWLPSLSAAPHSVTLAEYAQLELGMSVVEVQGILGRGIETSRTASAVTITWRNSDGSGIIAMFENKQLKSKQQFDLLR